MFSHHCLNSLLRLYYNSRIMLYCMLLLPCFTTAQVNDASLWLTAEGKISLLKRLDVSIENTCRINENYSRLENLYLETGVSYKIVKGLGVGMSYRVALQQTVWKQYSIQNRWSADVSYRYKIQSLSLTYRGRWQQSYTDLWRSADGYIPNQVFRNRLMAKYKIKQSPYSIGASCEYFSRLTTGGFIMDGLRSTLSVERKINKHFTAQLYLRHHYEINRTYTLNNYIVGVVADFEK